RRMCRDVGEAEECTQDAFVQAWRKLHLFEGESRFATWLHRVAVNTVLTRMRRARRDRDRLAYLGDESPELPVPDGSAGTTDIETALQTLPGGSRSVIVLCGIYGYSHAEASAMLGIAVGTCKAQLHRARRALAQTLAA
ncbi:MAG: RNA polymerase sigma factor, partial [Pseudomonadota bacterium]